MMITFNILGDCVSRDIVTPLIEQQKAQVLRYSSFSNPISMLSDKPNKCLAESDLVENDTNFRKRCTLFDFNKYAIDYVFEQDSDYLIFDILDARLFMCMYENHYITLNKYAKRLLPQLDEAFQIEKYTQISPYDDIDLDVWRKTIYNLCDILLTRYNPSQIILHKHFGVEKYINDDKSVKPFIKYLPQSKACNSLVKVLYKFCEERLRGCHIINFPEFVIADANHQWGIHYLHYHKLYYEYGSQALKIILQMLDADVEEAELENLRNQFSDRFELLHRNSDLNIANTRLKDIKEALQFTENLICDLLGSNNFQAWINECRLNDKKIVVLKCQDIAGRLIIKALEEKGVNIVLKMQNTNIEAFAQEQIEICRQADYIIFANVHSDKLPHFNGEAKIIHIKELIK